MNQSVPSAGKAPHTIAEMRTAFSHDWPLTVRNIEAIAAFLEDIVQSDATTKRIVQGVYDHWGAEHIRAANEELANFGELRDEWVCENFEDFYYCSYNISSYFESSKNKAYLELANEAHTVGHLVVDVVRALHKGTYDGKLEKPLNIKEYIKQNLVHQFEDYSESDW